MYTNDVMQSCKDQLKIHIEILLEQGIRPQNIEIELLHFLKKIVYADK